MTDQALDTEWKRLESSGEDAWTKQRYQKDGPTEAHGDLEVLDLVEDGEVRVRFEAEQFSGGWVVSYVTACSRPS